MNEIETAGLRLRRWREEDLDAYARICADPEVMRYMRSGAMTRQQTAGQIAKLVRRWEEHGYGQWAVEQRRSGNFIGRIGLMRYADFEAEPEEHKTEVGLLLDRAYWGRELATEGVRANLEWAFARLGFDRIINIMRPANVRSRGVVERAGLTLQGETRWRGYSMVWYAIDHGIGRPGKRLDS